MPLVVGTLLAVGGLSLVLAPLISDDKMKPSENISGDRVEAAIQRARAAQRSCAEHGPRSEPDATYCSECGRYLAEVCPSCGNKVEAAASRFCSHCGEHLSVV